MRDEMMGTVLKPRLSVVRLCFECCAQYETRRRRKKPGYWLLVTGYWGCGVDLGFWDSGILGSALMIKVRRVLCEIVIGCDHDAT